MRNEIQDEKVSRVTPVVEHMTMLRVSWHFEKVGYFIMFFLVFLAMLGVFSNGVLSDKEVRSRDGLLSISYERFVRNGTQTEWKVKIKDNSDHPMTLAVSDSLESFYVIENIQPQSVQVSHQGQHLLFTIPDGEKQQWHTFTFILRPKTWGEFNATLSELGSGPVVIKQWIYP